MNISNFLLDRILIFSIYIADTKNLVEYTQREL